MLLHSFQVGGVERVAAQAVQAVAKHLGSEGTVILATDGLDRTTESWFAKSGHLVVLMELVDEPLPFEEMALVVAQLINWWQPQAVLNMHSAAGWRALERFGPALTRSTAWSAGLFCRDRGPNGLPLSHTDRYLRSCLPFLERVICDHQGFLEQVATDFCLPRALQRQLAALFQPVQLPPLSLTPTGKSVLWAGRLCSQKRPELLAAVARLKPELTFDVYAPLVKPEQWSGWGLDQPNIKACGAYTTFSELPVKHYGAFLFTSSFEGLPNVLLEAGAAGLPLVASCVGGVQELVTPRTGWPVPSNCSEAEGLAEALDQALSNPVQVLARTTALRNLLKKRHSAEMYWQTAQAASSFFVA
jgi:hypothetical protein